jgi:hypothetical protein
MPGRISKRVRRRRGRATGDVIVFTWTVIYAVFAEPWPKRLIWVILGVITLFFPVLIGAFCGHWGALLAKFVQSTP